MKKLLLSIAFLTLPAWCQLDNGIIEGTVRDSTGATVPKAAVTLTETQTNNRFEVVTDGQGNYVSPPLKVGNYRVSVEAAGFKTYTRAGIVLQVQDRLRVDAALEVGSQTESVMVTGEVPPVQTDTSALGQVITQQQLVDMPLNGRNYANLAVLTPGVIDTSSGANGNQAGSFSSNGARGDLNNYILDGIDNNSNDGGGSLSGVNMEAIAEFKIQTNSYDAEFGRSGGAALNVVSKTGTNQIHGSVFEFYQNAYLNAQSFFSLTRPLSTKYNQPGGALGFPIVKNKLFFFGDWQMTDSHKPAVDKSSVPVGNEATGNFNGISGVHTIYDPTTYNEATGARSPFPNNIIPINEISPIGLAYAALYPQPNVPGATKNNYIIEPTGLSQSMSGDGRMDWRLSESDQIFGRYTQAGSTSFNPQKMPGLACGCSYSSGNTFSYTKLGSLGETHIFTPTTLNEFRIGFNWNYNHDGVPQGGFPAVPGNLQIPGVVNDPSYQGIANMAPSGGFSSLGIALFIPSGASSQERQIRDTLNLIRGRHTIRIGGEMRWTEYQLFQLTSPRGSYSFTGQYTSKSGAGGSTGNGLADMLVGIPLQSSITSYAYVGNRQKVPAVFVQDDWKVSHNLTLNLGLRYEYYQPTVDVHNHQSNFDYSTGQLDVAGINGNSRSLTNGQKLTFAPRVGFAYTPITNTVIRAGYGIFYSGQEVRTGDPLQLQYNLPFFYEPLFVGDGVTPALTLAQGFPPLNASQAINPSVTSVDSPTEKTPYYQQWNIALQRALPGKMSLEVAYAGSKGVHLQGLTDQNQDRVPGPGDVQSRRPYPFYGGFASIQDRGNSNFNSLQVKLQKFMGHGLYFLSSYTFSRAIDDLVPICCNTPWPDDSYNLSLLKGLADYQAKNRFVTSFDYQLPFGKGQALLSNSKPLDLIVGGWHWSGIFTMASGFPFTPQISYDSSNTGTQGFTNPDRIGNGNISGSQRTLNNWFNVGAFQDPNGYVFGNSGYNVLIGPGLINLDFGLRKIFNISERQKLQLRLEAFNALNHPNFGQPDNNIDDLPYSQGGTAGVITALRGGNRVTQIGMTYRF